MAASLAVRFVLHGRSCLMELAGEGWRVCCDAPGCEANVQARGQDDERAAIEASLDLAVAYGWQIASDRFIRPREDLCPDHRTSEE